jgi:hypothetical protein
MAGIIDERRSAIEAQQDFDPYRFQPWTNVRSTTFDQLISLHIRRLCEREVGPQLMQRPV